MVLLQHGCFAVAWVLNFTCAPFSHVRRMVATVLILLSSCYVAEEATQCMCWLLINFIAGFIGKELSAGCVYHA